MFEWPKLELTDHEREYVRVYKTVTPKKTYPGVLRRTYEVTIGNNAALNFQPSGRVQIARRSRVFGLTFSGGVSNTRLQITNASGTLYTVRDGRTGVDPVVSALLGGSPYMLGSYISFKQDPANQPTNTEFDPGMVFLTGEYGALLLEPNWVLTPNETLIFNGNWDTLGELNAVLNIGVHVWEFPKMGNADKAARQAV